MGRLWANEPQGPDGNSANSIGRSESLDHSHWMVQTVQPFLADLVAFEIFAPLDALKFDPKFYLRLRRPTGAPFELLPRSTGNKER